MSSMRMELLKLDIEHHLQRISGLLPSAYKLTLVARHTQYHPPENADIVMTVDDPAKVIEALKRLCPAETMTTGLGS